MSAFRGSGPKYGDGRYRELPLIQMVEEYLMDNSHQYFVNVEQMGEVIRKKSYRFARMKLPVFKERLKKAYEQYAAAKNEATNEFAGNDIVLDDGPLNEETLKQMEGDPSDSDSDAVEESVMDAGASQMKNLYSSGPGTINISGNFGSNVSTRTLGKGDQDECISVSSGASNSSPLKKPKPTNVVVDSAKANRGAVEDDGSGSDLEIIEEVLPNVETVIVSTNGNVIKSASGPSMNVGANGHGNRSLNAANQKPGSSRAMTNGPRSQNTGVMKNLEYSRGVKRKTAKSSDESNTGINEDFTRKRPKKEIAVVQDTGFKLSDFAGSEKLVEEVCKLLMHLKHPEIYRTLGVTPPRGFLLHGPPGTGKTLLANAIAGELGMPMLKIAGTELVSGISGESESNIRELFAQAVAVAPCIIFIDEIDSVTPKRENVNKEMERRIVAQLLACVDDLGNKEKGDQVLLIGATNRVEAIDTALRRAGRFDREICLGIPDESSREKILSVICRNLRLEPGFQISALARLTPGYVGADLQALVREAAVQAVNRKIMIEKQQQKDILTPKIEEPGSNGGEGESTTEISSENLKGENFGSSTCDTEQMETSNVQEQEVCGPLSWIKGTSPLTEEELQGLFVVMKDFEFALKHVQPSSKREGFATVPDTTWDDIGALQDIRDELQVSILGPVKHAEAFRKLGLTTPAGVLLCGPPGCGKTLLAKAVANEAGINFISVKGPELLNMYVGESERAVRQCFLRARNSSPCVIFFDELDALCPRRSEIAESGSGGRVVNQLLTEMDGMESRQGVFIMAATNRPDIIDPAILRPGRLDKILFVNVPTPEDRCEILKAVTKNSVLSEDVNLEEIARSPQCENYTGADLSALVREASIAAFRDLVLHNTNGPCNDLKVHMRHFHTAFTKTKPSVSNDDRAKYSKMAAKYSSIQ